MGDGDDSLPDDLNPTVASNFCKTFDLSLSLCPLGSSSPDDRSFSFPLSVGFAFTVSKSSAAGTGGLLRDRVAVRSVCSKEVRIRLKGFPEESGTSLEDANASAKREEEAEAAGEEMFAFVFIRWSKRIGKTAAAMCSEHALELLISNEPLCARYQRITE